MTERERLRLDLLDKYTKMLDQERNCDIEPWTCKVCGWGPVERYFACVDHIIGHLRRDELEPISQRPAPKQETVKPGHRPLDLD